MFQTDIQSKKPNKAYCNNFNNLQLRDAVILRNEYSMVSNITAETWIPIPGFDNYHVSSAGRIKHLKSYGGKPRILAPTIRENKYFYVTLSLNGKRKGFHVDRLVIMAFNSVEYSSIRSVKHVDGLKHNNQLGNLSFQIRNYQLTVPE